MKAYVIECIPEDSILGKYKLIVGVFLCLKRGEEKARQKYGKYSTLSHKMVIIDEYIPKPELVEGTYTQNCFMLIGDDWRPAYKPPYYKYCECGCNRGDK